MHYRSAVLSLILFFCGTSVFALDNQQSIRLIIKLKNPSSSLTSVKRTIAKSLQLPIKQMQPMANGAFSLTVDGSSLAAVTRNDVDQTAEVISVLHQDPQILYAVKDRVGHFKPLPDPAVEPGLSLLSHESQWDEFQRPAGVMLESKPWLKDGAWAHTTGEAAKPIVVAVLDTGIAMNNSLVNNLVKDHQGNVWGWNFADNNNNLTDETLSYHGTHVAGTIAGYGQVMMGMGEHLKILPVKIPNNSGLFYESSVINAIYWSVGADVPGVPTNIHPAKVLNMSFGIDLAQGKEIDYCDEALQESIFYARKKGAVLAVAAGNDNVWEHYNAPAVCNGTMKIASTGPEGLRSYFSNYGPTISFAAPGGDKRYGELGGILSTVNPGGGYQESGFAFYQGTSMATPHVAGVAGLIFAASSKDLSSQQVEQILYTTTHDFGKSTDPNSSCIGKKPCGHGILDAENAVKAVLANYDVYISAPKPEELAVKVGLASDTLVLDKLTRSGQPTWVHEKGTVTALPADGHFSIGQNNKGIIYAEYGPLRYRLDVTGFTDCQVIGFDGVGCHYQS